MTRDLSEPAPIPQAGIDRALEILESARLFRYGEFEGGNSETARLERDFATYLGSRYAVAMNSCGSTLFVALKCAGVRTGDRVLVNAFTLAPVPGAIEHAGAEPAFVECRDGFRMDLDDLERQADCGARVLLLSHMRGHIVDMDRVRRICDEHDLLLIEDCAHTLGGKWNGTLSGRFGDIACFSLQSFKHINAGEGGILATDDEDVAAQAILYSGSYMLYTQNGARPSQEVFERHRDRIPNYSLRMGEIAAAVARPQINLLGERSQRWNASYALLGGRLNSIPGVSVPARPEKEDFVASSIQFSLTGLTATAIETALRRCRDQGVDIKWFGGATPSGFTSTFEHWRYVTEQPTLPGTQAMLAALCDMRIPLSLQADDCHAIADIVAAAIATTTTEHGR